MRKRDRILFLLPGKVSSEFWALDGLGTEANFTNNILRRNYNFVLECPSEES